jgi:hypothetical protein
VVTVPAVVASAASDLASLGLTIDTATSAAAIPTTGIAAAAADEVSAQIAALFETYAQDYPALSAQASGALAVPPVLVAPLSAARAATAPIAATAARAGTAAAAVSWLHLLPPVRQALGGAGGHGSSGGAGTPPGAPGTDGQRGPDGT